MQWRCRSCRWRSSLSDFEWPAQGASLREFAVCKAVPTLPNISEYPWLFPVLRPIQMTTSADGKLKELSQGRAENRVLAQSERSGRGAGSFEYFTMPGHRKSRRIVLGGLCAMLFDQTLLHASFFPRVLTSPPSLCYASELLGHQ